MSDTQPTTTLASKDQPLAMPEPSTSPILAPVAPSEPAARSASSPPPAFTADVAPSTDSSQRTYPAPSHPPPAQEEYARPSPPLEQPQSQHGVVTEENADPQIGSLRAMFPEYDDAIIHSVLISVDGNQDRAVDALLSMSDPEYRSDAPAAAEPQPALTQTELDEQLARRLLLEDEQEHQRQWQAQQNQRPQYTPQRRDSRRQQQQQQPYQDVPQNGDKDTMTELQEQFTKIADTGKKTFGSIFSKVKAKIQEFDQPRPGQSSSVGGVQPTWSGSGAAGAAYGGGQVQQSYSAPQQPAYYDPNPTPTHSSVPYSTPAPRTVPIANQGYDATPNSFGTPQPASNSSNDVPRSPKTGNGMSAAAPIDGGKLGLLPKRPVSLIPNPTTQPAHSTGRPVEDESDDGLEYAENPFEDSSKK